MSPNIMAKGLHFKNTIFSLLHSFFLKKIQFEPCHVFIVPEYVSRRLPLVHGKNISVNGKFASLSVTTNSKTLTFIRILLSTILKDTF